MGLIIDPERLLADMEAMGVHVETNDPAGVAAEDGRALPVERP